MIFFSRMINLMSRNFSLIINEVFYTISIVPSPCSCHIQKISYLRNHYSLSTNLKQCSPCSKRHLPLTRPLPRLTSPSALILLFYLPAYHSNFPVEGRYHSPTTYLNSISFPPKKIPFVDPTQK